MSIIYDTEGNSIITGGLPEQNAEEAVQQFLTVARSYLGKTDIVYRDGNTILDSSGAQDGIDCSTFVNLCLMGYAYEKTPYNSGATITTWRANRADFKWAVLPMEYSVSRFADGHSPTPVRYATQIARWLVDRGRSVPIDNGFIDVEPGDLVFWGHRVESTGEWMHPDWYLHINHIGIVLDKQPAPNTYIDGSGNTQTWDKTKYPYKHTIIEVIPESPACVTSKWLEYGQEDATAIYANNVNTVVAICRPDLPSVIADDQTNAETLDYTGIRTRYANAYPGTYLHTSNVVGQMIDTCLSVTSADNIETYAVPVKSVKQLTYSLFRSSYDFGCVITNDVGTIIWAHSNSTSAPGTQYTVDVPDGAATFYYSLSPTLLNDTSLVQLALVYGAESVRAEEMTNARLHFLPYDVGLTGGTKTSLCLCGVKYDYAQEATPFAEGFLFHKLGISEQSLYYGTTLKNAEKVGDVPFDPRLYVFGISPTDGRVICGRREAKGTLYIWDGEAATPLFASAARQPYGWLYTTGIEFVRDGTTEYCVFAEYAHTPSQDGLYVWRGTYPYTSESNWEQVMYQQLVTNDETPGSIRHFHFVRRDPWTDALYLASGDNRNQLKWWYSTDKGATWTLLLNNEDVGWEQHVARACTLVFDATGAYWGSDRDENHCLNHIGRNADTGVLDPSTRVKLAALPEGQATNSVCLMEYPHGLFMYDRIDAYDIGREHWGDPVTLSFYSLDTGRLYKVGTVPKTNNWGGHRGKCYLNYTSGQNPCPAMGFSSDTPCTFTFVGASEALGTMYYDL